MTSLCVVIPYYMIWWGKYDLKDIIFGGITGLFVFWVSALIAKKVIDKIHL